MMLRFLCCLLAFLQVSCSAKEYIIDNIQPAKLVSHFTQRVISQTHYNLQQNGVPTVNVKEFYYFAAPEDKIESEALRKLLTTNKKHQQVIFIRSPENSNYEKVLQNLVQNSVQPQTHIYVLQNDPNYIGLQQQFLTTQKSVSYNPNVHFIKYRNPSEAERIQSSIIQQYGGGDNGSANNIVTNRNFIVTQHPSISVQHRGTATNKYVQTRAVLPNNTPVSKNYAMNYLPTGVDVVPGSSYIPLVKK